MKPHEQLTMQERAQVIKEAIARGIRSLDQIWAEYDQYVQMDNQQQYPQEQYEMQQQEPQQIPQEQMPIEEIPEETPTPPQPIDLKEQTRQRALEMFSNNTPQNFTTEKLNNSPELYNAPATPLQEQQYTDTQQLNEFALGGNLFGDGGNVYIVQQGDVLGSIARKHNTTVNDILAVNKGMNPDKLALGQKINIPKPKSEEPKRDFKTNGPINNQQIAQRQAYVESTYNPKNYNSGSQAAGLFQITPIVLKEYNERNKSNLQAKDLYDPVINAQVRNWYINKRLPQFQVMQGQMGDSIKVARALASYNWGASHVNDAIKKAQAAGINVTDGWKWLDYLPAETRNYVNFILRNKDLKYKTDKDMQLEYAKFIKQYPNYKFKANGGNLLYDGGDTEEKIYDAGTLPTLQITSDYPNEKEIKDNIESQWQSAKNLPYYNITKDNTFTREKTGTGSIEYFNQPAITYNNGVTVNNPNSNPTILFDPNTNTVEDIKLDLLHHYRGYDPVYKDKLNKYQNALLSNPNTASDVLWNSLLGQQFIENYAEKDEQGNLLRDNNGNFIIKDEYWPMWDKMVKDNINNEEYIIQGVDGSLRNLFIDEQYAKTHNYATVEEAQNQWLQNEESKKAFNDLKNYVITGQKALGGHLQNKQQTNLFLQ